MPRLSRTGRLVLPTALSRSKFCMLRAPICSTSTSARHLLDLVDAHHFADDRQARGPSGLGQQGDAFEAQALERIRIRSAA